MLDEVLRARLEAFMISQPVAFYALVTAARKCDNGQVTPVEKLHKYKCFNANFCDKTDGYIFYPVIRAVRKFVRGKGTNLTVLGQSQEAQKEVVTDMLEFFTAVRQQIKETGPMPYEIEAVVLRILAEQKTASVKLLPAPASQED